MSERLLSVQSGETLFKTICSHCKRISEAGHGYWHLQRCEAYAWHLAILEDERRSGKVRP